MGMPVAIEVLDDIPPRALGDALGAPAYFGHNPDALWDALGDYSGEPVGLIWRQAALSAERLGPRFSEITAVLQKAAAQGVLTLELA